MPKYHQIGSHQILLPDEHPLPRYQATWKRYDLALGYISQIVFSKYPKATAIDIGANVGDTAALLQKYQPVSTLCIEGVPEFIQYLKPNADHIGNITIAECFVGRGDQFIDLEGIRTTGGTASIKGNLKSSEKSVKIVSLADILKAHRQFWDSKLIKIDTDGFDFEIILSSLPVISKLQPVLHFEYDILFKESSWQESLSVIDNITKVGYSKFIVYDNYGNYLMSLSSQDIDKFIDLNTYLVSNRHRSGRAAVYYLDVCAFHEQDLDLFSQIKNYEMTSILGSKVNVDSQQTFPKSTSQNQTTVF